MTDYKMVDMTVVCEVGNGVVRVSYLIYGSENCKIIKPEHCMYRILSNMVDMTLVYHSVMVKAGVEQDVGAHIPVKVVGDLYHVSVLVDDIDNLQNKPDECIKGSEITEQERIEITVVYDTINDMTIISHFRHNGNIVENAVPDYYRLYETLDHGRLSRYVSGHPQGDGNIDILFGSMQITASKKVHDRLLITMLVDNPNHTAQNKITTHEKNNENNMTSKVIATVICDIDNHTVDIQEIVIDEVPNRNDGIYRMLYRELDRNLLHDAIVSNEYGDNLDSSPRISQQILGLKPMDSGFSVEVLCSNSTIQERGHYNELNVRYEGHRQDRGTFLNMTRHRRNADERTPHYSGQRTPYSGSRTRSRVRMDELPNTLDENKLDDRFTDILSITTKPTTSEKLIAAYNHCEKYNLSIEDLVISLKLIEANNKN